MRCAPPSSHVCDFSFILEFYPTENGSVLHLLNYVFTCQELDSFSVDFDSVILKILYSFFTSTKIKNIETCEAL